MKARGKSVGKRPRPTVLTALLPLCDALTDEQISLQFHCEHQPLPRRLQPTRSSNEPHVDHSSNTMFLRRSEDLPSATAKMRARSRNSANPLLDPTPPCQFPAINLRPCCIRETRME